MRQLPATSTSLHYYALYYCALLCLLHEHQQVAQAVTILIDGASTNEWATRDEYQQLINAAAAGRGGRGGVGGSGSSKLVAAGVGGTGNGLFLREVQNGGGGGDIEINRNQVARTISDLVPLTDVDLLEAFPLRRLKERQSRKHYCGQDLMDVLDLVCQGRYYQGASGGHQVVQPTIKVERRRSLAAAAATTTTGSGRSLRRKKTILSDGGGGGGDGEAEDPLVIVVNQAAAQRDSTRATSDNNNNNDDDDDDQQQQQDDALDNINTNHNQQEYLSQPDNIIKEEEVARVNSGSMLMASNNNQYQQQSRPTKTTKTTTTNVRQHVNNRHSRMAQLRRIRGAVEDCCKQSCYLEELKPYCTTGPTSSS